MRILLAEDDEVLSDGVTKALSQAGFAVDSVNTGTDADMALATTPFDLLILDLGLPKLEGLDVLRKLRGRGERVPVLILTARDGLDDRVAGLNAGADDYITKPFALPELEARVKALLRRSHYSSGIEITFGPLSFDTVNRNVTCNGQPFELSAKELAVLELLIQRPGRVINKEQLMERMYGWGEEVGPNAIEVLVHRLRKKLEPEDLAVRTIRGLGYLLELKQ